MTLADEKEALATIFLEYARYERPSTEWIAALDLFATKVAETEREACALACEAEHVGADVCDDCDNEADETYNRALRDGATAIRERSNAGNDPRSRVD